MFHQASGMTSEKANRMGQKVWCKEANEDQGLMKTGFGADRITRS